ncbi:conserved hypothetical protein [Ricinus communis]|uniref:RWP-RK domain-containing protein n=1 Tax=Ricinus communis TaxID=3988 RepID=B9RQU6_RICCO|nr:conserved hypothetical protein [Ricinus communis]
MADPRYIVPYHDPHNTPINLEYFDFTLDSNPTLANIDEQPQQPTSVHFHSDDIVDPSNPFDGPMIWNNFSSNNNNEAGPSTQNCRNEGDAENVSENVRSRCSGDGIGRPITSWPPPFAPFQCTYCQVLREIIHTDGNCTSKLEIHGRLGMICHAVLENRDQVVAALSVGIEWEENLDNDDIFDPSPSSWARQWDLTGGGNDAERVMKTALAQQRERTGKLTLKDFTAYFDLPIEEAAKRMSLCPTVVKKICRRYGMNRWPHRKIKSMRRQMAKIRHFVRSNNSEEKARALAEIQRLQQEIANICTVTDN